MALSGFVAARGLNLTFDPVTDLLLWPRLALTGFAGAETAKWIKLGGYAGLTPALLITLAFLTNKPKGNPHGKARLAVERDIEAAGLRSRKGLIAGFTGPLPSRHNGKPVPLYRYVDPEGTLRDYGKRGLGV